MTPEQRITRLENQNAALTFQLCLLIDQCINLRALVEELRYGKYDRDVEDANELKAIKRAIGSIQPPKHSNNNNP